MLGNGRGYELYRVGGGCVGWAVSTSSCWQPAHTPASLLLNVKARAERAALHLCGEAEQELVLPAAGGRGKALVVRASFAGFGCARLRLLTATVSGQQAPALPTAMPAVPKLAEVIV